MRAIGYVRVSTEEQASSGLGLEAQRETIRSAAVARGWDVEWIEDAGASGRDLRRPGITRALELLAAGEADALVAARIDRLGRSTLDVVGLAERADREGWALVVCDLGLDTTTPAGRFALTMLAAVAQLERDMIGQRTREALGALRERGARLGRPVTLAPEIEARIVAAREAGASLRAIADELTADEVPTAQGGARWHASTVRAVLARTAA